MKNETVLDVDPRATPETPGFDTSIPVGLSTEGHVNNF